MKLAAIYNVWADGLDLLPYSIANISPLVDGIIVIWSEHSNYGVKSDKMINFIISSNHHKTLYHQLEPELSKTPHENETRKRNYGLDVARKLDYTHFLMMDSDEFYLKDEFIEEKEFIEENDVNGTVCQTQVYFKSPTLTIGLDHTLVPFIHKITPELKFGKFPNYPFAYDKDEHAHIDPTRRLNVYQNIYLSGTLMMHHYSWVRRDYNLKIDNSSASKNLKKSSIYRDLENAKEGYYCEFYRSHLTKCDNPFKIPELL